MATRRLGRGLEALLVDIPNELDVDSTVDLEDRKQFELQRAQLLQETQQLKSLLDAFEQLVLQLEIISHE